VKFIESEVIKIDFYLVWNKFLTTLYCFASLPWIIDKLWANNSPLVHPSTSEAHEKMRILSHAILFKSINKFLVKHDPNRSARNKVSFVVECFEHRKSFMHIKALKNYKNLIFNGFYKYLNLIFLIAKIFFLKIGVSQFLEKCVKFSRNNYQKNSSPHRFTKSIWFSLHQKISLKLTPNGR
jgi:hypothetical protein